MIRKPAWGLFLGSPRTPLVGGLLGGGEYAYCGGGGGGGDGGWPE